MPAYDDDGFAPAAPVARVLHRHPESGESIADVPMLIDSGADATLLPKSAVESLGIVGTDERYQFEAFDSTTNESEAVLAVLVFLEQVILWSLPSSRVGSWSHRSKRLEPGSAAIGRPGTGVGRIAAKASRFSTLPRLPDRVMVRVVSAIRTSGSSSSSAACRTGPTRSPGCADRRRTSCSSR